MTKSRSITRALSGDEVHNIFAAGSDGKIKSPIYITADFLNVPEGAAGTNTVANFTVSRVGNLTGQTIVNWTTADRTATGGTDYVANSGQVIFQNGESQKIVQVTVNGDDSVESDEAVNLVLSTTATGYTIGGGYLTIVDDDGEGAAFDDPDYLLGQWGLNNTGQSGGLNDVDIDAPEAWTVTTGSMKTVLAEIDDGIDYTHPDVYLNIWLNQGEISSTLQADLADTDADGLITFRDLNDPANAGSVSDLNSTGYIDGGDLLLDPRWSNGADDEGNGKTDDLVGWDFLNNDNDPRPGAGDGHGTGIAQWMGAIPNNGIGKVGVNWYISMMPVLVRTGDVHNVNFSIQAAGLDYAVASGAPISAIWGGNTNYPQVMFDAVERARLAGHLVVAPAGNDTSDLDITPRYPPCLSNDNLISVTAFNANDGKDPGWNWGLTTVDLAGPTASGGGTSGGAAHVAAVAALLKTVHPEWNYHQLKDRILSTVVPSAAFAGSTVSGGRLNAANALGVAQITITDATATEGGTAMKFLDAFVPTGSGGLDGARDLAFHDGFLYAISALERQYRAYDAQTGAFESQFVAPGNGGLDFPEAIAFDSLGNLYVASELSDEILRYDANGNPDPMPFVSSGAGGLDSPHGMVFGPDGNLYVASLFTGQILRYQGLAARRRPVYRCVRRQDRNRDRSRPHRLWSGWQTLCFRWYDDLPGNRRAWCPMQNFVAIGARRAQYF